MITPGGAPPQVDHEPVPAGGHASALRALAERAVALSRAGNTAAAETLIRDAQTLDPAQADGAIRSLIEEASACTMFRRGRSIEAISFLRQALERLDAVSEAGPASRLNGLLALLLDDVGRYGEAVRRAQMILGSATSDDRGRYYAHSALGTVSFRLGMVAETARRDEAAMATARRAHDEIGVAGVLERLALHQASWARAAVLRGQADGLLLRQAEAAIKGALAIRSRREPPLPAEDLALSLAEMKSYQGEWDAALADYERLLPRVAEHGWNELLAVHRAVFARLLAQRGRTAEARLLAAEAEQNIVNQNDADALWAWRLLSLAHREIGDADPAARCTEAARRCAARHWRLLSQARQAFNLPAVAPG